MPKASVIMPVYNSARTLAAAVQSVLEQTWQDFSLIVVDDGSSDNSLEIVELFVDPRITVLQNGENKGIEHSLNRGIKAADCDWVFRLDSDDRCAPRRLEAQLAYLENQPDTWVLGSWAELLFDDNRVSLGPMPVQDGQIKARLLFHSAFFHPAVAIKRKLFDHARYSAKYPRAEDYDLWCKFAVNPEARFHNLPEALIRYSISGQGVSFAGRAEQLASTRNVREAFLGRAGLAPGDQAMQFYHAMAEGTDCRESGLKITALAVEEFLALLESIKKWCRECHISQSALSGEIGPRFTAFSNKTKEHDFECFESLKQSEFYEESAA